MADKPDVAKKAQAAPEPPEKVAPVKAEPKKAAPKKEEPAPDPRVHAGGHVLTDDTGWELEEEVQ